VELGDGEPKLLVPEEHLKPMLEEHGQLRHMEPSLQEQQRQPPTPTPEQTDLLSTHDSSEANLRFLPDHSWFEMPDPPVAHVETMPRAPRQILPSGVVATDPPQWRAWAPAGFAVPPQQELWLPPVGTAPEHVESLTLADACLYMDSREHQVIFAERSSARYVLCPGECDGMRQRRANIPRLLPLDSRPLIHLTYNLFFLAKNGFYHILQFMPHVVPFLAQLRAGEARIYIEQEWQLVTPVLQRLGVPRSSIVTAGDIAVPGGFCTPEVHLIRHYNSHPSPSQWRAFREELQLPEWPQPTGAHRRSIVLLSRGNHTRSLLNEGELTTALRSLGRQVELFHPDHASLDEVLQTLSRAEAVVGVHGANLANLVYAPPGTKVLEIVPQVPFNPVNYHYWALAGALKFPYVPVGQAVTEYDEQLAANPFTESLAIRSFAVDVERVTTAMARLLSEDPAYM
jgi:hypothetical protein